MDDIFRFIYKGEKSSAFNIGGILLAIFGMLIIMSESIIIGFVLMLVGSLVLVYQTGIEVDFKHKKYRLTTNFGPIVFGDWIDIPSLKYISVFKANISRTYATRFGNTTEDKDTVIQVNLITSQNKKIKLFQTSGTNQAFELAHKYAPILGLDIWDATEKEGKWL